VQITGCTQVAFQQHLC